MVMKILQDKLQIYQSRQALVRKRSSYIGSPIQLFLKRLRLRRGLALGDMLKSWDVLATVEFLESHVKNNEPILDIGCYASELIVALHKLGYSNLTGVDLNPSLREMPYQDSIHYVTADFMRTKFNDASFRVITSISVIEHGFNGQLLLKEVSRLLKPNGYFIASFDYWKEKIDTIGLKYFGMDWKIFSEEEIRSFVSDAAGYSLFPAGEIEYSVKDKAISCGGKQYTFAWLVLIKHS